MSQFPADTAARMTAREMRSSAPPVHLANGARVGRLTVVRQVASGTLRSSRWECRCDCGALTDASGEALRFNRKLSCGCLFRDFRELQSARSAAQIRATFWSRAVRSSTGCLEWPSVGINGYGYIRWSGRRMLAHRVAYELQHDKPIAPGLFVCHHCDNPRCIEPSHLFAGTPTDNMRDCALKGRNIMQTHPELSAHPHKLTRAAIFDIRARRAAGETALSLATEYGLSRCYAASVSRGVAPKRLPKEEEAA